MTWQHRFLCCAQLHALVGRETEMVGLLAGVPGVALRCVCIFPRMLFQPTLPPPVILLS